MDPSAAPMKIIACTCTGTAATEYQDKRYGKGKRAHNPGSGAGGKTEYRCTCCGNRK
jgi:hypothetical protein